MDIAGWPERYEKQILKSSRRLHKAIMGLTRANCLTGHYDNKSFRMAKIPKEEFTLEMWYVFYVTRKKARKYVELRAKYRGSIEREYKFLVNFKNNI